MYGDKQAITRQHMGQRSLPYTVYGHVEPRKAGLLCFTGQLLERTVQGYLLGNGYRLYSPMLMRFVSPDSFSPFGKGGCNTYAYCSGDPVNKTDPSAQAGGKTGLTKLLKTYGLPKKDLKPHLTLLNAPRTSGRSIEVVRVHEKQATTFEFSFSAGRFEARVTSEMPFVELSGHYLVKGNIYVPTPPENKSLFLKAEGFISVNLVPETHAVLPFRPAEAPSSRRRVGNVSDYINLSESVTRTRQGTR
ncbi:RHS repeat-associated core domain-containing protein [Pseudomonas sp. NBRC 111140]|nr:RHS repeat-associated core domain-containing protein [Pseudomonas sp. NBRC 111140]